MVRLLSALLGLAYLALIPLAVGAFIFGGVLGGIFVIACLGPVVEWLSSVADDLKRRKEA